MSYFLMYKVYKCQSSLQSTLKMLNLRIKKLQKSREAFRNRFQGRLREPIQPVLEFLNNQCGLGTEQEQGCITGPPGYTAFRTWFLGSILGLLKSLKIRARSPNSKRSRKRLVVSAYHATQAGGIDSWAPQLKALSTVTSAHSCFLADARREGGGTFAGGLGTVLGDDTFSFSSFLITLFGLEYDRKGVRLGQSVSINTNPGNKPYFYRLRTSKKKYERKPRRNYSQNKKVQQFFKRALFHILLFNEGLFRTIFNSVKKKGYKKPPNVLPISEPVAKLTTVSRLSR